MTDWAPDIPHEVRTELPPFGIKPHWVTFRFSAVANRLYDLYNAHVSADRADRIVWPTLEELAAMLKLSRGDKVTPYMRELEAGGAIEVEPVTKTGGKGRRYIITVKVDPPAGFDGPKQSSDWYAANRTDEAKKTNWAQEARAARKTAGQEVHPPQGVYVVPPQRGDVHPSQECRSINQSNQNQGKIGVADAEGKSAGGFARASAHEGSRENGGSAASGKKRQSQGIRTVKTRPPKEPAGYDDVRNAIPEAVSRPGTKLWPGLRRAICNRLEGTEGVSRRTPEQLIARINRNWYKGTAPERASKDYRGCPKCTTTGCTASRKVCDRILSTSSWLATMILTQDCPDPACEDGQMIDTGAPCRNCSERRRDEREEAESQAAQAAVLAEQDAKHNQHEKAARDEENRVRSTLGAAGVYGELLEYRVRSHMANWRDRHPKPPPF